MDRQTLLVATRNTHKTREIRQILGDRFQIRDLHEVSGMPEVEETGATFRENAALKAVEIARVYRDGWVLSDDSGLEVDALGGAPGVRSARYAGPDADDAANRARLLRELTRRKIPSDARSARFRCVMVLAAEGEERAVFDGTVEGMILDSERGGGGFGYDPLFVPEGHSETFAELPPEVKNRMSHRARALAKAHEWLLGQP